MDNNETIKKIIDDIIDQTFKVINNVYTSQRKSNPDNFTAPPRESFIVFPKKSDDDEDNEGLDRISEQELRFIFIEQFNKSIAVKRNELFYSIETPTDKFYYFSGKSPECIPKDEHDKHTGAKGAGRSANIDLVIFQKKGNCINRVALIEFKAHNPKSKDYRKDICKLIHENSSCLKYFIQIINNESDFNDWGKINDNKLEKGNTLVSIKAKIGNPDELRKDKIAVKDDYQINYWCGNLKKGQKVTGIINKNGLKYKKCESLFTEESTR